MHDGDHRVVRDDHAHEPHQETPRAGRSLLGRYWKWVLPGFLLATIGVALIPGQTSVFGFDLAIAPMVVGGAFIAHNTMGVVLETRRIAAGVLVVLAIVGAAYVGEYLAAAVVAFMMIGGEFLEDVTLEKTRNAVRELVRLVPDLAWVRRDGQWTQVSLATLRSGDEVLVKPGERIRTARSLPGPRPLTSPRSPASPCQWTRALETVCSPEP